MKLRALPCGIAAVLLAVAQAGCGGSSQGPAEKVDERYDTASRAGRFALENEQLTDAAQQYRTALRRAQQTDDIEAIGDASYNLAVVELRQGNARDAAAVAATGRRELERRGRQPFAALLLAEAAALYRSGDRAGADALLNRIVQAREPDAATLARAHYIRGLILADRGDAVGVRNEAAAIPAGGDVAARADRRELEARAAMIQSDAGTARTAADEAAALRREAADYKGMASALALAGEAAERQQDNSAAADRYLRAGRSALLQSDYGNAETWLRRARADAAKAGSTGMTAEIDGLLRESATRRATRT